MSRRKPKIFLLIWSILWTLGVGLFLCFSLNPLANQLRSLAFHSTAGTIDSIQGTESTGDEDSTSYGIYVAYHYAVNNIRYSSTRLRFGSTSFPSAWAFTVFQRFPANQPATVYYNPNDPAESVLLQGTDVRDVASLMFMTPFVVAGAFAWFMATRSLGPAPPLAGFRIIAADNITRIRPPLTGPLAVGAIILFVGSLGSMFVIMFHERGYYLSVAEVLLPYAATLLAALLAAGISLHRLRSGKRDLVIDDDTRQLTIPKIPPIPYGDLTAIGIEPVASTFDNAINDRGDDRPLLHIRLQFIQNQTPRSHTVHSTSDREQAHEIAGYLADRLKLPVPELDSLPLVSLT